MLRSIRGVAILDPYKSVIDPPFVIHLHDRAIKLNNCKSRAKTSTQCLKLTRNASLELHAKILFLALLESGTFFNSFKRTNPEFFGQCIHSKWL